MKKYNFIYKTINLVNGLISVGQHSTNNLNDKYLGSTRKLRQAIKEFGKENFKREILEFCDYEQLPEREKFWIRKLNAVNPQIGYNHFVSGRSQRVGFTHTEKSRNLISEHHYDVSGENNPNFGKGLFGEDHPLFGTHQSEYTKALIKQNRKPPTGKDNFMYGKTGPASPNFGVKRLIKECPYCGKSGGTGGWMSTHFDNCKFKNHD
jgi:group I intron endonuclease